MFSYNQEMGQVIQFSLLMNNILFLFNIELFQNVFLCMT